MFAAAIFIVEPAADARSVTPLPPPRPPIFGPVRAGTSPAPERKPDPAGPPATLPPVSPRSPAPGAPLDGTATGPAILHDAPTLPVPGSFPVDQLDAACTRLLAGGKVLAARLPTIIGADGCGITFPMTLRAIMLQDGQRIDMNPAPILRCDLAEALADWLRDDLARIDAARGRLIGVTDAGAYACRGRNTVPGAPMSEHGRGDAIDILSLRFANQEVRLGQADAHALWTQVKVSACNRFTTVLGPGSDGYHENNLHIDLESRRNGSHYCHWDDP